MPRSPEFPNVLEDIAQLIVYGNSIPAGGGASDTNRDIMTRFAQMIKAKEYNYAKSASRLHFFNDVANNRFGVYPTVFQTHKRPIRAASTLNADPAVGATSLTLLQSGTSATGVAFKAGDTIMLGTGDTGATGGETMMVLSDQSGTTLSIYAAVGWDVGPPMVTGGAIRDHATGDPVYTVPTQYNASNTIYLVCEAHNFTAQTSPAISPSPTWYQQAMRTIISRLRCAEVFEPDHTALKFTGTWGAAALAPNASSGAIAAQGVRATTTVNSAVEFHLPDNFPGGTAVISFVGSLITASPTWTFTVDGSAAGTLSPPLSPTIPVAQNQCYCKRFTGLSAGRHKIIAQITTVGTGTNYFDWAGIESPEPPLIVWFKPHRLYSYLLFGSGWDHGHIPTTLAAQCTSGSSSCSVAQTWFTTGRQIATTPVPKAGETITFEPGTANEETRTVTSITGAGPFTINFSGGTTAITHANASAVHAGIKDSDLATVNGWIDTVAAEFDKSVIIFDPERVIQKNIAYFSQADYAHWNDAGHQIATQALFDQLSQDPRLASGVNSRQSRPLGVPSGMVQFLATESAFTWAVPLALTEFGGATSWRRSADLSRAFEARLGAIQPVVATTGAMLRLQYSLDGGTTWFYLHRKLQSATDNTTTDWAEPTLAADLVAQVVAGTGTGTKVSRWQPIYPDALTDVLLRVVGIGGGAASSTFMGLWMEYR